jgi:hypothetical protein
MIAPINHFIKSVWSLFWTVFWFWLALKLFKMLWIAL